MNDMSELPSVLRDIVATRRTHLRGIRERLGAAADPDYPLAPSTRSLYASLTQPGIRLIMECKSASPTLGLIRGDYHPAELAAIYSRYAAGISVLCEPERFHGDYDHLATVAASTHLPVLCKDFIIDEVQVRAARYFGADAILLMLSVLDDATYTQLNTVADALGLDILTEVIDESEVVRAVKLGAKIIGINHRDLNDLSIDLTRSARLAAHIPDGVAVIAESGITTNAGIRQVAGNFAIAAGRPLDGFLVGSALTSQPDVDLAARALIFGENKVCGLRTGHAAQAARACGAVYGGLIFEGKSPRNVSRETARVIREAEPGLKYVAVSRREDGYREIAQGCVAVQVQAPLRATVAAERKLIATVRAELEGSGIELWRAVSMTAENGPEIAVAIAPFCDKLVLDAGEGGTGTSFDWATIPPEVKQKALLAGGITPESTAEALAQGCAGLDFNSGLENADYHKDAAKIRAAFTTIRNHIDD
ncbi:MAG: bifunctional indole-3-glycerol-phosphate synthase TrpC/phosphoribosylanthranilate isomerase TrpF [Corynebacterium sp.]|nr:bifunctional indole-3-glycerol-phosphate synthase TrpC/phosphoribosylanthranilate isomerase TrpF [Corynebacterium sp.]